VAERYQDAEICRQLSEVRFNLHGPGDPDHTQGPRATQHQPHRAPEEDPEQRPSSAGQRQQCAGGRRIALIAYAQLFCCLSNT